MRPGHISQLINPFILPYMCCGDILLIASKKNIYRGKEKVEKQLETNEIIYLFIKLKNPTLQNS